MGATESTPCSTGELRDAITSDLTSLGVKYIHSFPQLPRDAYGVATNIEDTLVSCACCEVSAGSSIIKSPPPLHAVSDPTSQDIHWKVVVHRVPKIGKRSAAYTKVLGHLMQLGYLAPLGQDWIDFTSAEFSLKTSKLVISQLLPQHPHFPMIHAVIESPSGLYVLMEHRDFSLSNVLGPGVTQLTDLEQRFVMFQLVKAIHCLHSLGLVHSSLHPTHIALMPGAWIHFSSIHIPLATPPPPQQSSAFVDQALVPTVPSAHPHVALTPSMTTTHPQPPSTPTPLPPLSPDQAITPRSSKSDSRSKAYKPSSNPTSPTSPALTPPSSSPLQPPTDHCSPRPSPPTSPWSGMVPSPNRSPISPSSGSRPQGRMEDIWSRLGSQGDPRSPSTTPPTAFPTSPLVPSPSGSPNTFPSHPRPRSASRQVIGSSPSPQDLQRATFRPWHTFSKDELVIVPRSLGGFSYARVIYMSELSPSTGNAGNSGVSASSPRTANASSTSSTKTETSKLQSNPYRVFGVAISSERSLVRSWKELPAISIGKIQQEPAFSDPLRNLTMEASLNHALNHSALTSVVCAWTAGHLSNFDYLMHLNLLVGRRIGDAQSHPILPWVIDFTCDPIRSDGKVGPLKPKVLDNMSSSVPDGWRDLTKSKYRITKGDEMLDFTYNSTIPHHITEGLSEITYYSYLARRVPVDTLTRFVRAQYQPQEYPVSMQRIFQWTPDECIPEFYTDPKIFTSIHDDMADLTLPPWAATPEEFINKHRQALESDFVGMNLHNWIDLVFGHKLSGIAAIVAKNVVLPQKQEKDAKMFMPSTVPGFVQLFSHPHPVRYSCLTREDLNGLLQHDVLTSDVGTKVDDIEAIYDDFEVVAPRMLRGLMGKMGIGHGRKKGESETGSPQPPYLPLSEGVTSPDLSPGHGIHAAASTGPGSAMGSPDQAVDVFGVVFPTPPETLLRNVSFSIPTGIPMESLPNDSFSKRDKECQEVDIQASTHQPIIVRHTLTSSDFVCNLSLFEHVHGFDARHKFVSTGYIYHVHEILPTVDSPSPSSRPKSNSFEDDFYLVPRPMGPTSPSSKYSVPTLGPIPRHISARLKRSKTQNPKPKPKPGSKQTCPIKRSSSISPTGSGSGSGSGPRVIRSSSSTPKSGPRSSPKSTLCASCGLDRYSDDLFGLGALLLELHIRAPPFTVQRMAAYLTGQDTLPGQHTLTSHESALISSLCHRNPSCRPSTSLLLQLQALALPSLSTEKGSWMGQSEDPSMGPILTSSLLHDSIIQHGPFFPTWCEDVHRLISVFYLKDTWHLRLQYCFDHIKDILALPRTAFPLVANHLFHFFLHPDTKINALSLLLRVNPRVSKTNRYLHKTDPILIEDWNYNNQLLVILRSLFAETTNTPLQLRLLSTNILITIKHIICPTAFMEDIMPHIIDRICGDTVTIARAASGCVVALIEDQALSQMEAVYHVVLPILREFHRCNADTPHRAHLATTIINIATVLGTTTVSTHILWPLSDMMFEVLYLKPDRGGKRVRNRSQKRQQRDQRPISLSASLSDMMRVESDLATSMGPDFDDKEGAEEEPETGTLGTSLLAAWSPHSPSGSSQRPISLSEEREREEGNLLSILSLMTSIVEGHGRPPHCKGQDSRKMAQSLFQPLPPHRPLVRVLLAGWRLSMPVFTRMVHFVFSVFTCIEECTRPSILHSLKGPLDILFHKQKGRNSDLATPSKPNPTTPTSTPPPTPYIPMTPVGAILLLGGPSNRKVSIRKTSLDPTHKKLDLSGSTEASLDPALSDGPSPNPTPKDEPHPSDGNGNFRPDIPKQSLTLTTDTLELTFDGTGGEAEEAEFRAEQTWKVDDTPEDSPYLPLTDPGEWNQPLDSDTPHSTQTPAPRPMDGDTRTPPMLSPGDSPTESQPAEEPQPSGQSHRSITKKGSTAWIVVEQDSPLKSCSEDAPIDGNESWAFARAEVVYEKLQHFSYALGVDTCKYYESLLRANFKESTIKGKETMTSPVPPVFAYAPSVDTDESASLPRDFVPSEDTWLGKVRTTGTQSRKSIRVGSIPRKQYRYQVDPWNFSGECYHEFEGHLGNIRSLDVFSGDESVFATGGKDVRVWRLSSNGTPHTLTHHTKEVVRVKFIARGKLVSLGADNVLALSDTQKGTSVHSIQCQPSATLMEPIPSEPHLVATSTTEGLIRVYDVRQNGRAACDWKLGMAPSKNHTITSLGCTSNSAGLVVGLSSGSIIVMDPLTGIIESTSKAQDGPIKKICPLGMEGFLTIGRQGAPHAWKLVSGVAAPLGTIRGQPEVPVDVVTHEDVIISIGPSSVFIANEPPEKKAPGGFDCIYPQIGSSKNKVHFVCLKALPLHRLMLIACDDGRIRAYS